MHTMLFPRGPRALPCLPAILSLLLVALVRPSGTATGAHLAPPLPQTADTGAHATALLVSDPSLWRPGPVIVVTNTNMDLNGEHWLPERLIANPGPDGISFAEALASVNSVATDPNSHETITFDPSLMGAVITTTYQLDVTKDGLTIDGDLDDDGTPDITIEGDHAALSALWINGASDVVIEGLRFRDFGLDADSGGAGISVGFSSEQPELFAVEHITIRNNWVSNVIESCIELGIQDRTHAWIRNVEITGNRLEGCGTGVMIWPGLDVGTSDNEISHVRIISNTLIGRDEDQGITIRAAGMTGNHDSNRNLVDDVEVRGNVLTGFAGPSDQTPPPILVDAANRNDCNDNTISNLTLAGNVIEGYPMAIEIVSAGENGVGASRNVITGLHIADNVLTYGGIQLNGTLATGATDNVVRDALIERNAIYDCANAGVLAFPGAHTLMYDNVVEDVIVRDNLVVGCTGTGLALDCQNNTCASGNLVRNISFLNNTVVDNGFDDGVPTTWAAGIRLDTDGVTAGISDVTIGGNVLWGNHADDALVTPYALGPITVTHSVISDTRYTGFDGNFYSDPLFVDPATRDYRLQPSSPCIDAGDPSGILVGSLDLDDTTRIWDGDGNGSAIVDCGAYERGAPGVQEMAVFGAGHAIHDGEVVPGTWNGTAFSPIRVAGETLTHTFTISNTGVAALALTGSPHVVVTGTDVGDFSVVSQPSSLLPAGAATTFTVAFDPSAQGMRSASLSIGNNDLDENPYTFVLEGAGLVPEIRVAGNDIEIPNGDMTPSVTDGTDFGTVTIGGVPGWMIYNLMNTGTTTLTLTGDPRLAITGPNAGDFSVAMEPPTTVAPDAYPLYPLPGWPNFALYFQPQAAGLRTAIVSIASDDVDANPFTFAIQGIGVDLPELTFSSESYEVHEGVGTAVMTATLSHSSTEAVTVDVWTELGSATACNGPGACDYQPISGTQLSFAPGETEANVEVDIVDDAVYETYLEDLRVMLDNADGAVGTPTGADLYIADDDPPPVIAFSAPAYSAEEGAGVAPITVTLQGATALIADVVISTTGGTATEGVDYTGVRQMLTFGPGVTSRTCNIPIERDDLLEDDETVSILLGELNAATLGTPDVAVLTILGGRYLVYLPLTLR